MAKEKKLTRRQRAVIEDLFSGEMDQQGVLEKHNVSPALYTRWLADEHFAEQFERRIAQAHHSGRIVLARAATSAACRLIHLTQCEKEEVARRACLDIISLHPPTQASAGPIAATGNDITPDPELPPETASRILAALARPLCRETTNPAQPS